MKKIIIGIMGVMFITTPVFAQTVPTDTPTVQDQYIQALQTVIGLLQQEVAMLVEQLKSISDNQASIATQVQQIAQNTTPAQTQPVFGNISTSTPEIDCTPTIEGQNIYKAGNLTTGVDMEFVGTSTVPLGCDFKSLENDLQTNQVKYHGKVSDWKNNTGQVKYVDNGFTFSQGWEIGSASGNVLPLSGNIIWYVGSSTLSIPYDLNQYQ